MGTIKQGITGAFNGRVGPIVGIDWRGISVIRARPKSKPFLPTVNQLPQLARFALITPFVSGINVLLNKAYETIPKSKLPPYCKAMSYNVKNAIDGVYPDFKISFARFILGFGDLLNPEKPAADCESMGTLRFTWTDNSLIGSARPTDKLFAAWYCEETSQWKANFGNTQRNAGSFTFDTHLLTGKTVQTYMGFQSADGRFVSTSIYCGLVTIL